MVLIWITGLSGSGKSTIGKALYRNIKSKHRPTIFLDGDSFREILGSDLSHTREDRLNNAQRISRMCQFLVSQDMFVICATMSLFKEIHQANRSNITPYYEVFIECDQEELIKRDQKGLYSRALKGEINNVVGIDLPYDKPIHCDLIINNTQMGNIEGKVDQIMALIKGKYPLDQ